MELSEILRDVVLLLSSSRGGSSITAEFFRQRNDLLHLRAEINPFLYISRLTYPNSTTGSDRLLEEHVDDSMVLWKYLRQEIGTYERGVMTQNKWKRFSKDLWFRLGLQWPNLSFELPFIIETVERTVGWLRKHFHWQERFDDVVTFHCIFLQHLRERYPMVDPRWYDISEQDLKKYFPKLKRLYVPKYFVEEPPFVLIAPWRLASEQELQQKTLIIKTPSNAYRIPFFRQFFKRQRLRILHVKRDVKSSVQGLLHGWRYQRGFHSHIISNFCVEPSLIPQNWWKYDLPPLFETQLNEPLPNICLFQWMSSHQWILREKGLVDGVHGIWFEDILDNNSKELIQLWKWLNVPVSHHNLSPLTDLPLVMASRPRQKRIFDQEQHVDMITLQDSVQELMSILRG